MPDKENKTYKEKHGTTRVGDFLRKVKGVAPDVLRLAGNVTGVDALKNLGNAIQEDETMSDEKKEIALAELELDLKEYELEVEDRDSARKRQIEVAKAGKKDLLYNVSGFIGLGVFAFVVYSIIYLEVPEGNKEIFIHLIGIVEGVALSIFGFFFGTSDTEKKKRDYN